MMSAADDQAAAVPAPCFPCTEQPCRIVLRMGERCLWSNKHGKVQGVYRGSAPTQDDEFVFLPVLHDDNDNDNDNNNNNNSKSNNNGKDQNYLKNVYKIQSYKHKRFLQVTEPQERERQLVEEATATVNIVCTLEMENDKTMDEEQESRMHWSFQRELETGRVMLTNLNTGETLTCDANTGALSLVSVLSATDLEQACWNLHTITGELGYLSCATFDRRIRCDMVGMLRMTASTKGWEVWRFMEAASGHVRISSWMHSQYLLCVRIDEGNHYKVTTCTFRKAYQDPNCDTEWAISKAPDANGLLLRSKKFGRLLSVTLEGQLITNSADQEDEIVQSSCIWQVHAAHLQRYTLSCRPEPKSAESTGPEVSVGPFPFVTPQLKQSQEWIIEHRTPGVVAFCKSNTQELSNKEYLGVNSSDPENKNVWLLSSPQEDGADLWKMQAVPGGYTFESKIRAGCYLAFQQGNETSGVLLCTSEVRQIVTTNDNQQSREKDGPGFSDETKDDKNPSGQESSKKGYHHVWLANPVMPRAVSSSKIKTFAIGTTIAVSTTVAMPFAMMGVMGLLGAIGAEVGILANIVTVALTGAEALASVGVVGATAAIIFRESNNVLATQNSQDDEDDQEEANAENIISKRPFCAWRSW